MPTLIEMTSKDSDPSQLWLSTKMFWLRGNSMILLSKQNWRQMRKPKRLLKKRQRRTQKINLKLLRCQKLKHNYPKLKQRWKPHLKNRLQNLLLKPLLPQLLKQSQLPPSQLQLQPHNQLLRNLLRSKFLAPLTKELQHKLRSLIGQRSRLNLSLYHRLSPMMVRKLDSLESIR